MASGEDCSTPRHSVVETSAPGAVPGAPSPADGPVNPLAMTVAQAAKVLSAVGAGVVTEDLIRRHIAAGTPTGPGGRINLVHYAAWLNRELARSDGD